ncbi:hypothetical protein ACFFR8_19075 [Streptoalloteichus tenebrarius]|uniref:hypothetical protein n=1 Tax=Streptoalloteichus tenebrarius (strain ATCC 17920 / DSM 40477 / JCM 4838 / CBS 697.72 / NBRC 16177 / NCIMB 11028 / NRRL B-12390 / A12253. 1 / ISP 5477) TaxID=1933 RepID=UPI0020A4C7C3|nr:hypothetical protein [Streptoalloteichus tenebrarius]
MERERRDQQNQNQRGEAGEEKYEQDSRTSLAENVSEAFDDSDTEAGRSDSTSRHDEANPMGNVRTTDFEPGRGREKR